MKLLIKVAAIAVLALAITGGKASACCGHGYGYWGCGGCWGYGYPCSPCGVYPAYYGIGYYGAAYYPPMYPAYAYAPVTAYAYAPAYAYPYYYPAVYYPYASVY